MTKHTTTLREKTMALLSRFFQARFSTALLRSAALAIVLLVQTSPVRAEVVTLVCQSESGNSMTIRVDYDRKIVDLLRSDGSMQHSAPATITEGAVEWNAAVPSTGEPFDAADPRFMGALNRLTGQGNVWIARERSRSNEGPWITVIGPCRRATQKF